jgi:SAM-dependent methyltransferase
LILKHRKIARISYAHEWCGAMLKDAALFHLDLCDRLTGHGLYLKDAHPWNILFERGRPVFVDFTSIVTRDLLLAEPYLRANTIHRNAPTDARIVELFLEISRRMYVPYFVKPLCGYAYGDRSRIRSAIEETTLNTSSVSVSWRDALPSFRGAGIRRLLVSMLRGRKLFAARAAVERMERQLEKRRDTTQFLQAMRAFVTRLQVETGNTAYSAYYKQKGEDTAWTNMERWNDKQKSVRAALESPQIATVLDVACNTGWFAVMAEKMGKQVVAFDIDEGGIEVLYGQVRREKLDILPLVMNFTDLTQDRHSVLDGKRMLINAQERLKSDGVIALGIIHHLVLGAGLSFEQVLDKLVPLCAKRLVLEFVDKSDAVIRDEPSFFPAFYKDPNFIAGYGADALIGLLEARGFDVAIEKSHPATRSILVCTRRA